MLSKNRIKQIQSLQLKKNRDLQNVFIAEGIKTVLEITASRPELIQEVLATRNLIETYSAEFTSLGLTFNEVSDEDFNKVSLQSSPAGIMAICSYFKEERSSFDFTNNFSFYLDDVRDPGNFGTIVRLADWFGITNIFCSPNSCDLYNPKVIQATMGAFLRVNVTYTELAALLKEQQVGVVYGAVLNGKNIYREQLKNGLILIGNEANGIREENLTLLTDPLTIPAHRSNGTESLNAAIATSIIASEFFRQLKSA